jgi:micrococcal nuclease
MTMFDHDFVNYPELTNTQLETLRFVSPHEQMEQDFVAVVEKVHDGDTITLKYSRREFSFPLRLLDIDAPELSEGGDITKAWLSNRALGKTVLITIDTSNRVDKYGRLLGRLFINGLNVAEEMIHLGLAVPFGLKHEGEPLPLEKTFGLGQWFS